MGYSTERGPGQEKQTEIMQVPKSTIELLRAGEQSVNIIFRGVECLFHVINERTTEDTIVLKCDHFPGVGLEVNLDTKAAQKITTNEEFTLIQPNPLAQLRKRTDLNPPSLPS